MPPQLAEIIENGPSLHRIHKGLLLISNDRRREPTPDEQQLIVASVQELARKYNLLDYTIKADATYPALLHVITPWATVHTPAHRDLFFKRLCFMLLIVLKSAETNNFFPFGTGVNPFVASSDGQPPVLCADIHEIEVRDDLEMSRIYNIFRQYLPELIAISTHSALYGGRLQKDLSTRMRINPASFTPPPLPLFSSRQLERLRRDVRKRYGLTNLAQLDLNFTTRGSIALRFVDAQASLRFIRGLLVLFQAIAIHGRALARQGSQLPTLHNRVIGENKALAIEGGPGAILKPDRKYEVKSPRLWYQDRKTTERASTALIEAIELNTVARGDTILDALRSLKPEFAELAPWLLGAELRRREHFCLVNYAEYQMRLYHVAGNAWPTQLQNDMRRLLHEPMLDYVCDYNQAKFAEASMQIAAEWQQKLMVRDRLV